MPIFPILYQKKANGKQHFWKINVISKKVPIIKVEYGQIGGKVVVSEKEITIAKGKKTLLEQAISEAQSKWNLMRDKKGYVSNKQNTGKLVIRPMLAKTFKMDEKNTHLKFPCYIQPKLDGVRCIANGGSMITRSGKTIHPFSDIQTQVDNLGLPDNTYLDGELYSHSLSFQRINGLTNLKTPSDKDLEDISKIEYHVFDLFDVSDLDKPFEKRFAELKSIVKGKKIKLVQTQIVKNKSDIQKIHEQFIKDGYEGSILRNIDSPYELNKRSSHLWKYKDFEDAEFKIVGYKEGTGKAKGTVIWRVITKNGAEFDATQSGPFEIRKQYFKDAKKYLGKKLTVRFQGYYDRNGKKVPRIAVAKGVRYNI